MPTNCQLEDYNVLPHRTANLICIIPPFWDIPIPKKFYETSWERKDMSRIEDRMIYGFDVIILINAQEQIMISAKKRATSIRYLFFLFVNVTKYFGSSVNVALLSKLRWEWHLLLCSISTHTYFADIQGRCSIVTHAHPLFIFIVYVVLLYTLIRH